MGDAFDDKLVMELGKETILPLIRRLVSGTYKNGNPASDSTFLELRVDVDGRRPQMRISGDIFMRRSIFDFYKLIIANPYQQNFDHDIIREPQYSLAWLYYTRYEYSFIVEDVTVEEEGGVAVLTGPITYCNDPTRTGETIEVRIKRVGYFSKAPGAVVYIYKSGTLLKHYCLDKISEYFRTVTLEVDALQGTSFPPSVDTDIDPSPSDLPATTKTTSIVYRSAGIDMTVKHDEVLNDVDGDANGRWNWGELHDLMEDRFDLFHDTLQWNTYGVIVPEFEDSGVSGIMFDWGGGQPGDTYFRQGCAIAEDTIRGITSGTLYDTSEKRNRLILWTFCHELGHSFNLPHTWQRTANPDNASESFMNYITGYTGGGGASGYWSNFRWEFDDCELIWMRHQCRNDVIFGGNDWIGNNLSVYLNPQAESSGRGLQLTLDSDPVLDCAEPVRLELTLTNISEVPQLIANRLNLEDRLVKLFIRRPGGEFVRFVPPIHCEIFPGDFVVLEPGESIQNNVLVSFSAKGNEFQEPGEYRLRAYYGPGESAMVASKILRIRVSTPKSRQDEELAHMLFDQKTAKFLYFNGSERYPQITSDLMEAVSRYGKSNPRVVKHIRAALGMHMGRNYKRIKSLKNRRVVVTRKPQFREAISMLKASLADMPAARHAQLTTQLSDIQIAAGQKSDARRTLDNGLTYLKSCKAGKHLMDGLKDRMKGLPKGRKKK